MDIPSLNSALLNTINPDRSIRRTCEFFLQEEQTKQDFLPAIFYIIEQNTNNPNHLDLLATIYLKKFLEKSFKFVLSFNKLMFFYVQAFKRKFKRKNSRRNLQIILFRN